MIKNICIIEDDKYENFLPLVYMRPVYDLRTGILTLREKIEHLFPFTNVFLQCRKYLEEKVRILNPGKHVNDLTDIDECLFINGRVVLNSKTVEKILKSGDAVYYAGGDYAGAKLSGKSFEKVKTDFNSLFNPTNFEELDKIEIEAVMINYPWDLISKNSEQIINDFVFHKSEKKNINGKIYHGSHLLNPFNIYIGDGTTVKPGAVIDAEDGPVYIGKNVNIMPNAVIIGPCYIGDNSIIKAGAKIYQNTSIGEYCKIGGEVEGSIILSYANKQHDGFLGHSYISSWCNLGADTNTSDLKNNYANVVVNINGKEVDTGSKFIGLIMGDHSKCSINTMFNTGTICGISSNIFGSGFPSKNISSFSWGGSDSFTEYNFEKAVEVAKIVMKRRNVEFTSADEKLFKHVFEITSHLRK